MHLTEVTLPRVRALNERRTSRGAARAKQDGTQENVSGWAYSP
jgi:hypothetical protein